MSQPTDLVTKFAAYDTPYYGTAPVTATANVVGQFTMAGSGYNQTNVLYVNTSPILDAGPVIGSVTVGQYPSNI